MNRAGEHGAPLLEVSGLDVDIARRGSWLPVVTDLSLAVRAGETVGLVGESGCGKSTVALAILRLLRPANRIRCTGTLRFDGRDLGSLDDEEMRRVRGAEIAMIPQDASTSLNPLFTIGNQVSEAVRVRHHGSKSETDRRVLQCLERAGLEDPERVSRLYPHELSGGMRQRVLGAIAMSSDPKLLIADEPTTALDVTVQAKYLDMLDALKRETGMAIVFITHDLGVVARICDRLAVMYAGRIVERGPVGEVLENPAHWYTQALLQSSPPLATRPERLPSIRGVPPRPGTIAQGCLFADRCDGVQARCRQEAPVDVRRGHERSVRCWYPDPAGVN